MAIPQITREEAEKYKPRLAKPSDDKIELHGKRIAYNSGKYGWNWDLILYRGKYYVVGYRNFPKTYGKYKG